MTPRLHGATVSSLCSIGPAPQIMTGILRQWLIAHFVQADQIQAPELRTKLWSQVRTTNGIEIESITRWKPEMTEFRPAIIISRNDWKTLRLGIDDRMMGEKWDGTGEEHYGSYIKGSHTLFCISNLPTEAEILGGEVYNEMLQFGPVVRRELEPMVKQFVTVGAGKIFELEEARENYAVPVTVAYGLQTTWKVIPYAPFLKRIVLSQYLP